MESPVRITIPRVASMWILRESRTAERRGPDRTYLRDAYRYQEILPLRTRNADGSVILIDGNAADHRGADVLAALEA
jgi:hypothetical protein